MNKTLALLAVLMVPCFARANAPFRAIQCLDENPRFRAPVFIDVQADVPNSSTGTRFTLGNVIPIPAQPGRNYEDASVYGDIDNISFAGNALLLAGNFGSSLRIDWETGMGLVSGPLKYDPKTGEYVGFARVTNYPVKCAISR